MEHDGGSVKKVSLEMLSKAREIAAGGEVSAIWLGSGYEEAAEKIAQTGPSKVYVCDDTSLEEYLIGAKVDVVAAVAESASVDVLFVASSADGKDIGTRVAARLGGGVTNDITDLKVADGKIVATYPAFGGSLLVECWSEGRPAVYIVKPNAFGVETPGGSPEVVKLDASSVQDASRREKVTE